MGTVRRIDTGKFIVGHNHRGYRKVKIKNKSQSVHRLVMAAFAGESPLECNHINGVKHDNRLSNLEYCTTQENIEHAMTTGLRKNNRVYCVDRYGHVREFRRSSHAARELGISVKMIDKCLYDGRKSTHGYSFSLRKEDLPSRSRRPTNNVNKRITDGKSVYASISEASRKTGLSARSISKRLSGKIKKDMRWKVVVA